MESIVSPTHWLVTIGSPLGQAVVGAGFWAAIALPLVALGLLATGGSSEHVAILIACDLGCLLIGHSYDPAHNPRAGCNTDRAGYNTDRAVREGSR